MQTLSGNQRPHFKPSLMNMFLLLRLPCELPVCRSSSNAPHVPMLLKLHQDPHVLLTFDKAESLAPATQNDIGTPKSPPNHFFLTFLTCTCASRHNGIRFFDISTSKSAPNLMRFAHFDLEMLLAPKRCAPFHVSSGHMAPHPPL